jgi:hypothetical protein
LYAVILMPIAKAGLFIGSERLDALSSSGPLWRSGAAVHANAARLHLAFEFMRLETKQRRHSTVPVPPTARRVRLCADWRLSRSRSTGRRVHAWNAGGAFVCPTIEPRCLNRRQNRRSCCRFKPASTVDLLRAIRSRYGLAKKLAPSVSATTTVGGSGNALATSASLGGWTRPECKRSVSSKGSARKQTSPHPEAHVSAHPTG